LIFFLPLASVWPVARRASQENETNRWANESLAKVYVASEMSKAFGFMTNYWNYRWCFINRHYADCWRTWGEVWWLLWPVHLYQTRFFQFILRPCSKQNKNLLIIFYLKKKLFQPFINRNNIKNVYDVLDFWINIFFF